MFHFHTLIQQKAQHFPRFRQKKQNIFVGFTFFRNILPGSSTKCKTFSQVPAQIANHFPRFQHKYQNIFTGSEKKKFEKKKNSEKMFFFSHKANHSPRFQQLQRFISLVQTWHRGIARLQAVISAREAVRTLQAKKKAIAAAAMVGDF